jgi:ketosteroid isomerase-like protein
MMRFQEYGKWLLGVMGVLLAIQVQAATFEDQLADRLLIQEVQNRYALAHDLTDPSMYASVFTEDAELVSVGRVLAKGREALYAIGESDRKRFNADAAEGERSFGVMRHVVTNSVIDLTGADSARAFCYVLTIVNAEGVGPQIMSVGRYEDNFEKVDGQWLISRREIVMDMGNQDLARQIGL